jgi:hypothetical protein
MRRVRMIERTKQATGLVEPLRVDLAAQACGVDGLLN